MTETERTTPSGKYLLTRKPDQLVLQLRRDAVFYCASAGFAGFAVFGCWMLPLVYSRKEELGPLLFLLLVGVLVPLPLYLLFSLWQERMDGKDTIVFNRQTNQCLAQGEAVCQLTDIKCMGFSQGSEILPMASGTYVAAVPIAVVYLTFELHDGTTRAVPYCKLDSTSSCEPDLALIIEYLNEPSRDSSAS